MLTSLRKHPLMLLLSIFTQIVKIRIWEPVGNIKLAIKIIDFYLIFSIFILSLHQTTSIFIAKPIFNLYFYSIFVKYNKIIICLYWIFFSLSFYSVEINQNNMIYMNVVKIFYKFYFCYLNSSKWINVQT
jgi:hypothetical protein